MFDAEANRKRLGLDEHTARVQRFKHVASTMTDREHDMIGRDAFTAREQHRAHALRPRSAVVDRLKLEVFDATTEANLTTERENIRAHLLHHAHESERSNVRLTHIENLIRRASIHELAQYLASIVLRILDLAIQLAIRKRTCAAFTELRVRFRIKHAFAPHLECVLRPFTHSLAPFKHNRSKPRLRKDECSKQPRRSHPNHNGTSSQSKRRRRARNKLVSNIRRNTHSPISLQSIEHLCFIKHLAINRVHK